MTEPVRGKKTVTPGGERLDRLPDGLRFKDVITHVLYDVHEDSRT